jgi:MscS family membrane protein
MWLSSFAVPFRLFIVVLLSAVFVLSGSFTGLAAGASAASPLEPLDTTSPRATLTSFLDQTQAVEQATLAALADRSAENRAAVIDAVDETAPLFDLSQVPEAAREQTLQESFAALADILYRVPLPPANEIPDAEQVEEEELNRWVLPGTEITLVRLDDELRPGAWVFSAQTVAKLPQWRSEVSEEPVLVEDAQITDWRTLDAEQAGRWVPMALIDALPSAFQREVLGNPLWKVIAGVIVLVIIVVLTAIWHRYVATRLTREGVQTFLLRLSTPVVLIGLTILGRDYMEVQVNYGGAFAQIVLRTSTAIIIVAVAWLAWILVRVIGEWIIHTSVIKEQRYNEHLVRLLSRLFSLLAAVLVLLIGMNSLGIPALGLITGLGVGGLVAGLAAQGTLENLIGGFTLFADKPFRVGDFVTFTGVTGTVEEIGQRSTRIRLVDGTLMTVPNADIARAQITNVTERRGSLFLHTIGVRYETTREQLQQLVVGIEGRLREHPLVLDGPELPRVTIAEFGDSSIDIEVRALVETNSFHTFMITQQELLVIIRQVVEEVGTSMAFPSTTAYLAQDAIPESSVHPPSEGLQ